MNMEDPVQHNKCHAILEPGRCVISAVYNLSRKYCYARAQTVLRSDELLSSLSSMPIYCNASTNH